MKKLAGAHAASFFMCYLPNQKLDWPVPIAAS
jgi:hypothetical protein